MEKKKETHTTAPYSLRSCLLARGQGERDFKTLALGHKALPQDNPQLDELAYPHFNLDNLENEISADEVKRAMADMPKKMHPAQMDS
jgi:hypothetical protein